MRVTIFNQKGGVGKTTTTLSLSAALYRTGHPALAIDLDPQAHLSAIHGTALGTVGHSVYAYFQKQINLPALEIDWPGVGKLIPAHSELIKVDS